MNIVTWNDLQTHETLELSDLGDEMTIINGCLQLAGNVDIYRRCPDDFIIETINKPLWFHERGLLQTATGYGDKLITEKMVRCSDHKLRRIYCSITSNIGTCYINVAGNRLIIN